MARKNTSDDLCVSGRGNVAVGNMGPLDDLIAAEAVEKRHAANEIREPKNRRALKKGVKIRLGLPANE